MRSAELPAASSNWYWATMAGAGLKASAGKLVCNSDAAGLHEVKALVTLGRVVHLLLRRGMWQRAVARTFQKAATHVVAGCACTHCCARVIAGAQAD